LGHHTDGAPGDVSLSDAMCIAHFALNQVQDVLCQERADLDEERLCLSVWLSLLKKLMASEKAKAKVC
jgi:hypothetical protein